MKIVTIKLKRSGVIISKKCRVANTFTSRLFGLIGTKRFPAGEGLFFPRCNSIHMWFMSVPIDVLFIREIKREKDTAKYYEVSSARKNIRPWRLLPVSDFSAADVLELPENCIKKFRIKVGDVLCIS